MCENISTGIVFNVIDKNNFLNLKNKSLKWKEKCDMVKCVMWNVKCV